jgi:hypothetical protein
MSADWPSVLSLELLCGRTKAMARAEKQPDDPDYEGNSWATPPYRALWSLGLYFFACVDSLHSCFLQVGTPWPQRGRVLEVQGRSQDYRN